MARLPEDVPPRHLQYVHGRVLGIAAEARQWRAGVPTFLETKPADEAGTSLQ
jgi:hypothetical protein